MNDHMLTKVENGLFEQMSYSVLQDRQYESTVDVVKRVLYPFLELHYGQRCDDFESGCECCIRWAMADRLLARDRVGTPEKLKDEIRILTECLNWRQEMLNNFERMERERDEHTSEI